MYVGGMDTGIAERWGIGLKMRWILYLEIRKRTLHVVQKTADMSRQWTDPLVLSRRINQHLGIQLCFLEPVSKSQLSCSDRPSNRSQGFSVSPPPLGCLPPLKRHLVVFFFLIKAKHFSDSFNLKFLAPSFSNWIRNYTIFHLNI